MTRFRALVLLAVTSTLGCGDADPPAGSGADDAKAKAADPGVESADAEVKTPSPEDDALVEGAQALARVSADRRPLLAAKGLALGAKERLPAAAIEMLDRLPSVAPDQRSLVIAQGLAGGLMPAVEALCGGKGAEVMQQMAMLPPEEKSPMVWRTCELGKHGLVDEARAHAAEPMPLLFAHVIKSLLDDGPASTSDDAATALLVALVDA
jgi:hypothetical protein